MSMNDTGLEPATAPDKMFGPTEMAIRNMITPLGVASPVLSTAQMVRSLVEHYRESQRENDRLKADNDDKNQQILRMNLDLKSLAEESERSLSVAETDDKGPEYPGLPQEFAELATAALDRFAEGYAEYGPRAADALGLAGQWGDLHRKVMKLKASMWAGNGNLTRETEEDILNDIIGHCLLALEMYARDFEGGRS